MMKMILALWLQGIFPCFLGLGGGQFLGQAKELANASSTAMGQYGSSAASEGSQLNPFYSAEMKEQHSLTPQQQAEMFTAAGQSAGGAFGGAEGEMNNLAARTGNATTLTKSLDEMARNRAKAAAGTSEGIAAEDVSGARQDRQAGAAGMQGLYGTNVGAQLGAMKENGDAIKTEEAVKGKSWLQQLSDIADFGGKVMGDISGAKALFKH